MTKKNTSKKGLVLFQAIIASSVMIAILTLAVDLGLVYLVKHEMQCAADSAALAAVAALESGDLANVRPKAVEYAQDNPIYGEILCDPAIVVKSGRWTQKKFTEGPVNADCVQVTVFKSKFYSNAVKLVFAPLIGVETIDVKAVAIAHIRTKAPNYRLVGIDHASIDSIGVLSTIKGNLVSNGNVSVGYPLGILVSVQGEARSANGVVRKGALAAITQSTQALNEALEYPSVVVPTSNNNTQIAAYLNANGDFNAVVAATIPGGVYVVRDFNIVAGLTVNLTGPVTVYVTRNFTLAAGINLLGNPNFEPKMLKIRVAPGGGVLFLANLLTPVNMDLYAPDSDLAILVTVSKFKGRLVGKSLVILTPALSIFEEDTTLEDPNDQLNKFALVS